MNSEQRGGFLNAKKDGIARNLLRLLSMAVCVVLFMAGRLAAEEWKRLSWNGIPKDKKGEPVDVSAIGRVGEDHVYLAFSDSHLVRWDGREFKEIEHEETGSRDWDIRNFLVNSAYDVWAVGDNGLALHYDGVAWNKVETPLRGMGRLEGRLWGAGCAKPDLCFAGTPDGRLIQWNGKAWQEIRSPVDGERIYGMVFPTGRSGWMVGENFFARWDGKSWKKTEIEAPRLYAVAMVGPDFGWAVGDRGAFFRYRGGTWRKVEVKGSFFRMRDLSCSSVEKCWAVGEAGAAFKWDGRAWARVRIGTFHRLTRVSLGEDQGFIGGDKGILFEQEADS